MNKKLIMPAEWEPHEATLMEFPVFWNNGDIHLARKNYIAAAEAIAQFEPVEIIVNENENEKDIAASMLQETKYKIELVTIPHDDAWARDNCPTFVKDESGSITAINWQFNAWGKKYPKWDSDDAVPQIYCQKNNIPLINAPLILEGGSIHSNGKGLLLTTSECLLNPNRNPTLRQDEIEVLLKKYTGAEKIIWLPYGVPNDETDGHIDNVCCFFAEDAVLLHWIDDERSRNNYDMLCEHDLRVVKMPAPIDVELPAASYVNFYICNGGVIVPQFGVSTDEDAVKIIKEVFPDHKIVPLNSLEILRGGGNIHCITQQLIKGKVK